MSTKSKKEEATLCVDCLFATVHPGLSYLPDEDFYFGVPVCSACGGLGFVYDNPEFKRMVKEVNVSCSEYFPNDNLDFPTHPVVQLKALKELVEKITKLNREFGIKHCPSFAKMIANGYLNTHIQNTKILIEEIMASLEQKKSSETIDLCLSAKEKALHGDLEEAHGMFKRCVEKHPDNSVVASDYANFLVAFKRDFNAAAIWFVRATEGKPKKIKHFMNAVVILKVLGRDFEARNLLMQSLACPDADSVLDLKEVLKNLPTNGSIN